MNCEKCIDKNSCPARKLTQNEASFLLLDLYEKVRTNKITEKEFSEEHQKIIDKLE
jgi:hypothetical protein